MQLPFITVQVKINGCCFFAAMDSRLRGNDNMLSFFLHEESIGASIKAGGNICFARICCAHAKSAPVARCAFGKAAMCCLPACGGCLLRGQRFFQMCWSINSASCALGRAPLKVATGLPPLNMIRVGMLRMPKLEGTSWLSSTLILAICTLP